MKTLLEALEFVKEHKLYDKHINIALGINKIALSFKEAFTQLKMENDTKGN